MSFKNFKLFLKFINSGQLPGLKYAKGVSKWPVYFKDKFYATYDEAKKARGSDFWYFLGTLFFWRLNFFIRIVGNDLIFTLGCYKSQKSTQISHQPVLTERV